MKRHSVADLLHTNTSEGKLLSEKLSLQTTVNWRAFSNKEKLPYYIRREIAKAKERFENKTLVHFKAY